MFTVNEFSPWLFQGGLVLIGFMTLIIIIAATSPLPNIMTKLLANKPLMVVGDQSYSLYIWHWPIIIYLVWIMPEATELSRQIAAVVLTIVISTLSHPPRERPIHKNGLRAYIKGFPKAGPVIAVVAVLGVIVGSGLLYVTEGNPDRRSAIVRLPADPNYGKMRNQLGDDVKRDTVVIVGASTVLGLIERGGIDKTPDLYTYSAASLGCTTYLRDEVRAEGVSPDTEECVKFRARWTEAISKRTDPIVVLFLHTRLFSDFVVDGKTVTFGSPEHDQVLVGILDEFKDQAMAAGASKIAIVNMACHDRADFGKVPSITRSNSFEDTKHLNQLVARWSEDNDATVFDQYSLLCEGDSYFDGINGVELYDDGLHFSWKSAPIIWQWMANEIRMMSADAK